MTTRYQNEHYEDVAKLLRGHNTATNDTHKLLLQSLTLDFADLFAADNPANCTYCGHPEGRPYATCHSPNEEHTFKGGFDRELFLAACGLESEGDV